MRAGAHFNLRFLAIPRGAFFHRFRDRFGTFFRSYFDPLALSWRGLGLRLDPKAIPFPPLGRSGVLPGAFFLVCESEALVRTRAPFS